MVSGEAENFCKWDWTRGIRLIRFNKLGFWKLRSVVRMKPPAGARITQMCAG